MGNPTSDDAFADARAYMDKALESERGIRIKCASPKDAWRLRMRCYTARTRAQAFSRKVHDPSHPRFSTSAYDGLVFWREDEDRNKIAGNPGDMTKGEYLVIARVEGLELDVEEI